MQAAFSAYTAWGFGRRVIGVTDRRMLLLKSRYWSVQGKCLLWADPIRQVALRERVPWFLEVAPGGPQGNFYLEIRRANGKKLTLNMRQTFVGRHGSASEAIKVLQSLVPRSH